MNVKVRFFASFREIARERERILEVALGTTPAGLLADLAQEFPALAGLRANAIFAVNGDYVAGDTALNDGDEVVFIPPVSGGQGDRRQTEGSGGVPPHSFIPPASGGWAGRRETGGSGGVPPSSFIPPIGGRQGMYQITEGELSVEDVAAKVRHSSCGAITIFVGTVRDVSKGRKVLYLEYEAYKEMAEKKLAEIGEEIRSRWGLDRVAISHRVGRLDLGEASVVIAVASPHRAEAFEACRLAIEALKKTVPIWKKEVWEDGEVWVGLEGTGEL